MRYEGGNLVIDLDGEDYKRGVEELKYNIVGKQYLLVGGDHYHIILRLLADQSIMLSNGPFIFTLGMFSVSRWLPGFHLKSFKSTTNVWVRMYGIPLEYHKKTKPDEHHIYSGDSSQDQSSYNEHVPRP